jgi:predicted RNase H-like nuclease (RuvC/YqgF family)
MTIHVRMPVTLTALSVAAATWLSIGAGARAAESDAPEAREPMPPVSREAEGRGLRPEGEGMRQRRLAPPAARQQDLKRALEGAMAELQELREAGKEEEAMQKKRQVQELQQELGRLERMQNGASPRRGPLGDRPGRRDVAPRPPMDTPELERKLQHLQAAIENLHAAGMHEPAERLAQQAEMMRRNLQGAPSGQRPPGARGAEVERLQSEVQELRQAVGELKARLEDLARDVRKR